jgi:hypothetical protein
VSSELNVNFALCLALVFFGCFVNVTAGPVVSHAAWVVASVGQPSCVASP